MYEVRTIVNGLHFGEGPRWHKGELWFSDMHGHKVLRTSIEGRVTTVVEVAHDQPSGLGWLPDGRLLIVAMGTKKLLRLEGDGNLVEHADLSLLARTVINDMIVAADGTAYVGDVGASVSLKSSGKVAIESVRREPGQTIRVSPDGTVTCAADDLQSPNGHILTEDGRTLILTESFPASLTAFDVRDDGTLCNRRTFAELPPDDERGVPTRPDGICLDAEGAVWVADIFGRRLIRVREGGAIAECIRYDSGVPVACVLGGEDRRTLLICAAQGYREADFARSDNGRIDACEVAVPGAGRP